MLFFGLETEIETDLEKARKRKICEIYEADHDCMCAQTRIDRIKAIVKDFNEDLNLLSNSLKDVEDYKTRYLNRMTVQDRQKEGEKFISGIDAQVKMYQEKITKFKRQYAEVVDIIGLKQYQVDRINRRINEFRGEVETCQNIPALEEITAPNAHEMEAFDDVERTICDTRKEWRKYDIYVMEDLRQQKLEKLRSTVQDCRRIIKELKEGKKMTENILAGMKPTISLFQICGGVMERYKMSNRFKKSKRLKQVDFHIRLSVQRATDFEKEIHVIRETLVKDLQKLHAYKMELLGEVVQTIKANFWIHLKPVEKKQPEEWMDKTISAAKKAHWMKQVWEEMNLENLMVTYEKQLRELTGAS